jgi:hypothetical protein
VLERNGRPGGLATVGRVMGNIILSEPGTPRSQYFRTVLR